MLPFGILDLNPSPGPSLQQIDTTRTQQLDFISFYFISCLEMKMLVLHSLLPQVSVWMSRAFLHTPMNLSGRWLIKQGTSAGLVSWVATAVCFPGLQ